MEVMYTDINRLPQGSLEKYSIDLELGGDNDFELQMNVRNHCMSAGCIWYVENEEYGGIVDVVLCQEKVQIKCNQFSLFLTKSNLLFLLHSPRCFQDIVPHIHLETNIHNDCEYALYCKMFRCTQKSVYMHVHN